MRTLVVLGLFVLTMGLGACSSNCHKGDRETASLEVVPGYHPTSGELRH